MGVLLSAVNDVYGDARFFIHVCRHFGDVADGLHAIDHLSEDDMLAVKVGAFF